MKVSENLISLCIFAFVCISILAHVYINSYVHELLIVFRKWQSVRNHALGPSWFRGLGFASVSKSMKSLVRGS